MGCQLLGCSNDTTKETKLDNINHNFFEIESNALTYRSKPGFTTERSYGLSNTSTLFTNEKHNKPKMNKLNLSNLMIPQLSERSITSRITSINETKDKLLTLLSERNGKSFSVLSKEITFVIKLIHKLNRIYSSTKFSNYNSNTIDYSFCSNLSECKMQSISTNNNLVLVHSGDFSFKNKNESNISSKVNKLNHNNNISLFNKFKNLFYTPLISLTGEIENFFSLENISNKKESNTNTNNNNLIIQLKSFSVYFDFFETFFTYVFNLFQNLNYNAIAYKNEFIKLSSFLMDIQKIKIQLHPNENTISLSFYYLNEEFFSHFIRGNNKRYIDIGEENELSKSIEKECLSIIFSTSEIEKLPGFCRYKIWYRNINMSNNDYLKILQEYLVNKVNNKELIQHFNNISSKHMRNCGFVVGFAILIDEYKNGNLQNCVGFEIKIKTNHDKLIGLCKDEINEEKSWDNEDVKENKEEDHETELINEEGKVIKINLDYCQVMYLNIQANHEGVKISYEYSFK
jgi:hypothetical protein